jgi:4-hydroxy-3-polyprenylbenzoate decarboxylase
MSAAFDPNWEGEACAEPNALPLAVAISGASGVIYGMQLLRELVRRRRVVHWTITEPAARIVALETPYQVDTRTGCTDWWETSAEGLAIFHPVDDVGAPPASGSCPLAGMAVIPCSGGRLGRLAAGTSDDLPGRMAEVCLKERRPLIIVLRETPLSLIHIRNMLALTEAGATILPASPGFYHQPRSVADMVDFVVACVLRQLRIDSSDLIRGGWEKISASERLMGKT